MSHFQLLMLRPVYTGNFCCDFKRDSAACKLLAIQIAAESPLVYMGDLNRRKIALEISAAKIASVNGPLVYTTIAEESPKSNENR